MTRVLTTLLLTCALTLTQLVAPPSAEAVYILDYGDTIQITVKDAPQYAGNGLIRPDGVVVIPWVGEVEVLGLTPDQAAGRIASVLRPYLQNPQVQVTVTGFKPQRVTFLGQVGRPGLVNLPRPKTTIFEAISVAGGFTDRAVPSEVVIIRGEGANAEQIVVNIEHMLKTADFTGNVLVRDGDKIQVKEVWWPNWTEIRANLGMVLGMIASIALLLTWYERASGD